MKEDEQKQIASAIMREQNNRPVSTFEGYSPLEMNYILYNTFGSLSPLKLLPLDRQDYNQIPFVRELLYFAGLLQGEVKLTQKGYLPVSIVKALADHDFLDDQKLYAQQYPGVSEMKVYKETDSITATLVRIMSLMIGLIKKRNNKISLTKAGEKWLSDPQALFRTLIANYCSRFNWAYFDRYDMDKVGQLGSGFSLILLHKYGDRKRTAGFYADKYFKAFPQLIAPYSNMEGPYAIKVPERCYSLRTFERFMQYFGLIHMEQAGWDAPLYISRTVLFDRLITCIAHKEA